ncbi:MAG: SDR family NAD(P)-dependent oxidoreductase, partial [Pseudomonadota bacterium]
MVELTTALVTGASSGIGAGVVEVLSAAGFKVTALARRADRLSKLSDRTGCAVAVADVTDPASMAGALSELEPDIVVCNAGLGAGFDGVAGTASPDIKSVIDTNVTGTLNLLNLVLPGMIARKQGHVVTVGSVAALYPSNSALYGASKAAIRQIALNLR